jgi:hypothetical protein
MGNPAYRPADFETGLPPFVLPNNNGYGRARKAADAYINISFPANTPSGKSKVGAIYLHIEDHGPIIEMCKADPAAVIKLMASAIVDFQLGGTKEGAADKWVLPGMEDTSDAQEEPKDYDNDLPF